MVLIIPSWSALHAYYARQKLQLLTCLVIARKRFVWYLSPINRRNIICNSFPTFKLAGSNLNYVAKFKYLSHLIDNKLCVDLDIEREIKKNSSELMYYWKDLTKCSQLVKLRLFRSYCLCSYDIASWCTFSASVRKKLSMCYYKCMKAFFGYRKYDSVTNMLLVRVDWKWRTWKWRTKIDQWHENAGPENAEPQKQDRKMEDKLPKAIT